MNGGRRSWSAEAHTRARLGLAIAASAALHLGVMPSLTLGLGGPGDGGGQAQPLRAWIARENDEPRVTAERAAPDSQSPVGPSAGRVIVSGATGRGLPVVSETRYFLASELDHRPVPLLPVEPRYPDDADGRVGRVVLNLFIDQDGHVDKVVLVSGDHSFEGSAIWAFGQARFSPGVRRGAAVKSQMLIEVTYHPDGSRKGPGPRDEG